MGHRTLKQDISYSELRTMRDSGMSVREIAIQLDVSVSTVYRYLGSLKDIQASKPIKGRLAMLARPWSRLSTTSTTIRRQNAP